MNLKVFTQKGEIKKEREVSSDIFGLEPNIPLLTQYLHIFRSNQRQGTSSTKTRSEVSGGGIKPWRQKGTGRARHGSRRSPIWVHGGIAHGPQMRSWTLSFPKKMKSVAFRSALSLKSSKDQVLVLENINIDKPSTSLAKDLVLSLRLRGRILLVQSGNNLMFRKSFDNLPKIKVADISTLCTYDILLANKIVFTEEALDSLEERYATK